MKLFGSVYKKQGLICFESESHVSLRLKRVFPKIDASQIDVVKLSLTPENAHEVLWWLERYPHRIGENFHGELMALRKQFQDKTLRLNDILNKGKYKPNQFKLAIPARDYQKQGADLLLQNGFLVLGDDVGTGKTCVGICTFTDQRTLPAIVVTLAHLPQQWAEMIERFLPGTFTHVIKKGAPYELPLRNGQTPDVLICNYHKLNGWAKALAEYGKSIIFDEAHELRRSGSDKYNAAKFIASNMRFRLGLTATPIFNYGGEMFNLVNCMSDGMMGNRDEFLREWCGYSSSEEKMIVRNPKAFGAYLRENFIMLRRTRADVKRELQPLQKIVYPIECDESALDAIEGSAAELAKIILGETEKFKGQRMMAAASLDALIRQATGISKAPYVADFVRLLVESGEKVVLFGWHREFWDIIAAKLVDLKPVFYTGEESPKQKEESKMAFVFGDAMVMCISLRAGAGMDGLQGVCKTGVIGELDWSPAILEQNIGRFYRDGQPEKCMAYILISSGGTDPLMVDTLGLKKEQLDGINNPDKELIEKLQVDRDHIKKLAKAYLKKQRGTPVMLGGPTIVIGEERDLL